MCSVGWQHRFVSVPLDYTFESSRMMCMHDISRNTRHAIAQIGHAHQPRRRLYTAPVSQDILEHSVPERMVEQINVNANLNCSTLIAASACCIDSVQNVYRSFNLNLSAYLASFWSFGGSSKVRAFRGRLMDAVSHSQTGQ